VIAFRERWADSACRDPRSPEKQVEQILAFTPILPGQQQPQARQAPTQTNENLPPQQETQSPSQPQQIPEDDLIDFGQSKAPVQQPISPTLVQQSQNLSSLQQPLQPSPAPSSESARPKPAYMPTDLHVAQTENGGQRQIELENKLQNTSITPLKGTALTQLEQDLQREKDAKAKQTALKRQDTEDSDDEFVDAQG